MAKDDRPRIANLGEWYEDLLKIDSTINGRSEAQQAASLLCAKLQERELKIKERVAYLAAKRGITFEEMWVKLLKDDYRKLTSEEIGELDNLSEGWK
jgi:hypothetical protein